MYDKLIEYYNGIERKIKVEAIMVIAQKPELPKKIVESLEPFTAEDSSQKS
ncbi:hypothetical protein KAX03_02545 [Candidatus Bathyarchaeota archaeon]|nr:hypothetical protein [Candidatus Bathyarchaeota archaeon]